MWPPILTALDLLLPYYSPPSLLLSGLCRDHWGSRSCCKRPTGSQRPRLFWKLPMRSALHGASEQSHSEKEVCSAPNLPHLEQHRLSRWIFLRSTTISAVSSSPHTLRSVSPSAALRICRETPNTLPWGWARPARRGTGRPADTAGELDEENYTHGVSSFSQASLNICAISDKGRIFPKILPTLEIEGKFVS